MINQRKLLTAAVISIAISGIYGCGQDTDTEKASSTPMPAASPAPEPVITSVPPKSPAEPAMKMVEESAENMSATEPQADTSLVDEATSLIEKVKEYIANNDFDLAKSTLDKLAGMRSMLPDSFQSQIDSLQNLLSTQQAAAEGASSMEAMKDQMPSLGK